MYKGLGFRVNFWPSARERPCRPGSQQQETAIIIATGIAIVTGAASKKVTGAESNRTRSISS